MEFTIENITLKMCEKTMLPESERVETDGKVSFRKTGNKVERTTCTFTDSDLNKLVFLTDNNDIRNSEGKTGELRVSLVHDSYNGINKVQFLGFLAS